jgi:hypothetical protein
MKGQPINMRLPSIKNKSWLAPFCLFWVTFLAYGVYIPWLGLYGDDWLYLWNYHLLGSQSFVPFVAMDRPFSAWIYILSTAMIGEHIWAYHVLALLLRFLDVLVLWWVLKLIWPRQTRQVLAVALLFAIYPGFKQQAIPIEFILHFAILGLFLVSLGLMILAVRGASQRNRWGRSLLLLLLSLILAAGMFSVEYFVGLELIRPVILWLALREDTPKLSQRIRQVLAWSWPYLLLLASFIFWRVFIYKFDYFYQPILLYGLQTNPRHELLSLARRIIADLYLTTIGAWSQVFVIAGSLRTMLLYIAVVGVSLVTVGWLVIRQLGDISSEPDSSGSAKEMVGDQSAKLRTGRTVFPTRFTWSAQAAMLGLVSLVVAGIPFWITGISITITFPWDRSTLPFMLGVSLLMASLLELILTPRFGKLVLVGLIALSIGAFAKNARTYLNDWSEQSQFIWQLVWRAPQLKPGTLLVTQRTSLDYIHDNGLTPIVNWTYAPELKSNQIPYTVFERELRKNTPYDVDLSTGGKPIEHSYRIEFFSGSTSEMVLFYFRSPACLRIIRPNDASSLVFFPSLMELKSLSRLDQISADPLADIRPPLSLHSEPRHTWCYYFEKADLARQLQDWQQITALWETAANQSFAPTSNSEYEPFIEAFARLKNWEKALELSHKANTIPDESASLCALWHELEGTLAQDSQDLTKAKAIEETLSCPVP